jgi:hypothetical protein
VREVICSSQEALKASLACNLVCYSWSLAPRRLEVAWECLNSCEHPKKFVLPSLV